MDLAYAAGRAGGTMTGVLSAANEKAVELFIDEKYDTFCIMSTFVCFLPDKHYMFIAIFWFGLRNILQFIRQDMLCWLLQLEKIGPTKAQTSAALKKNVSWKENVCS